MTAISLCVSTISWDPAEHRRPKAEIHLFSQRAFSVNWSGFAELLNIFPHFWIHSILFVTCVVVCDWHDFSLNLAVFAEDEDLILHFALALECQLNCTSQNKSPLGVWAVFGTAVKIRWSVCHWLLSSTCHTVVRPRGICQKGSFIPQRAFLHVGASGWAEILPSSFQNVLWSYYSTIHPVTSCTPVMYCTWLAVSQHVVMVWSYSFREDWIYRLSTWILNLD